MEEHTCDGPAEGSGWSSSNLEFCGKVARFYVRWSHSDLYYWLCAEHYDEFMRLECGHDA